MLMPSHAKNVKLYQRRAAGVHALRHREPARRHVLADRAAALRRLHRHQPDRGAGRDRRELRPRDARAPHRGHRAQDQSAKRRRKSPGSLRLRDLAGLIVIDFIDMDEGRNNRTVERRHEGSAQARPRPHPGRPHLAFRPAGNVAPAHPHLGAGKLDREVPALRRLRPRPLGVVGRAAIAARASRKCCSRARRTI